MAELGCRLRHFLSSRAGNFSLITAFLLPATFGVASVGLDLVAVVDTRIKMQSAVDAAALSAAAALSQGTSESKTKELAASFVTSQLANLMDAADKASTSATTTISTTENSNKTKTYTVKVTGTSSVSLSGISRAMGLTGSSLTVSGTAQSGTSTASTGISLYLVLDRSGSMSFVTDTVDSSRTSCQNYRTTTDWAFYPYLASTKPCYVNKMTSLKTAVAYLAKTINGNDPTYSASGSPTSTLVRTGAVAYNDEMFTALATTWGTASAVSYVQAIPEYPTGGTDATDAMTAAYDALKSSNTTETKAHATYKTTSFNRYIIFMTDGEMTGNGSTFNQATDTAVRKVCATAKADGIKIFSVGFMAPTNGKALLQSCASSSANVYEPETMEDLVSAFGAIAKEIANGTAILTN